MKKKTKTILISTLVPTFIIGGPLIGVGIQQAISHDLRTGFHVYNENYIKNPTLYKNAFENQNILIEKPFKKIKFKTTNKLEELKKYVKSVMIDNYYILPWEISLFKETENSKENLEKQWEELLINKDSITLFYLPKVINDELPLGYNIKQWYFSPFKEYENFKILTTNIENEYSEEIKNWDDGIYYTYPGILYTRTFGKVMNKHKILYNDKELEVLDIVEFGIRNYKEYGQFKLLSTRYFPKDHSKTKEYKELKEKDYKNNESWLYKLNY